MRIVRYITIFRGADDFWPYRLSRRPCRRRWCELPRLDFRSDWTTGTAALVFRGLTSSAMQIARYLTIFSAAEIFSAATIFGLTVSLVAPVAAAGASCLAWILDLAGRQAPRRSCPAG